MRRQGKSITYPLSHSIIRRPCGSTRPDQLYIRCVFLPRCRRQRQCFPTRFPLNAFNLHASSLLIPPLPTLLHCIVYNNTPFDKQYTAATSLARPIGKSEILIISASDAAYLSNSSLYTPQGFIYSTYVEKKKEKTLIGFFPLRRLYILPI